ncbi:cache domain-containing sensor histidine kinase [Gracilibacillus timonensis]|uniref:cache domain-containing sensor histidine kinase n=1 Tax=Gracilibacillus timonensis TaxID=1816696 RepID=UPI0008256F1D|nr:histidine kinase [Gracilibacillus timonensis]
MARFQWKFFNVKSSFKMKLIVSLSAVILIVFCISGYISYRIYLHIFEEELSKQVSMINEQALERLELRIQSIYRISNYIDFNSNVEEIIKKSSIEDSRSKYEQYLDSEKMDDFLNTVKFNIPQLKALYFYDLKGKSIHIKEGDPINNLGKENYLEIVSSLQGTDGEVIWKELNVPSSKKKEEWKVIVASKLMKTSKLETYGMMVMIFNEAVFSELLNTLTEKESERFYLFDQRDQLLYTNEQNPEHINPSFLHTLNQTEIQTVKDIPYLFTKSKANKFSFSLVSRTSLQDIQKESQVIFKISLYSGILAVVLAVVLVIFTSLQFLRPLKLLVHGMQQLRKGNFDTHIEVQTKDELAFIGESFNSMVVNINSLIKEVYERQLNEKKAELKAFQAQLNPHFLYNTLDTIYWNVYLKDDIETAKLVVSLSEMLRYVLEPVDEWVTLEQEIDNIKNYMNIQEHRFKEELETTIRVEENVNHCLLIRLLLQPLVENIFVHAFRDKETNMLIDIHAYRCSNQLIITIIDNGSGMDPETLEQLWKGSLNASGDQTRQKIGMASVINRIELVYGEPYRLEMLSKYGEGTTMKLILPYQIDNGKGDPK